MKQVKMKLIIIFLAFFACNKEDNLVDVTPESAYKITKNISYNDVSVNVIIDKPEGSEFDVLIVFHGTVQGTPNPDAMILQAAENTLNVFKGLADNKNLMIVSVAYPQENILFGDNIIQAEAALLWVKHNAKSEIGVDVKKIFLAGHSQGGYIVTRLNTMHQTNGVVANAPGPLNLVYRCQLEENGQVNSTQVCNLLRNHYGTTTANPNAYFERSLLNFTNGFKSDILFVQGLNDSPIQMHSWPIFKDDLINCNSCQDIYFLELAGLGHNALFNSPQAKIEFNTFINSR
jgi:poly(3-hydroxybutyrate) depolymerase